jgi:hypothetical protein
VVHNGQSLTKKDGQKGRKGVEGRKEGRRDVEGRKEGC